MSARETTGADHRGVAAGRGTSATAELDLSGDFSEAAAAWIAHLEGEQQSDTKLLLAKLDALQEEVSGPRSELSAPPGSRLPEQ